jgi:hypothetical protein
MNRNVARSYDKPRVGTADEGALDCTGGRRLGERQGKIQSDVKEIMDRNDKKSVLDR